MIPQRHYFFSRKFRVVNNVRDSDVSINDEICIRVHTPSLVQIKYTSNAGDPVTEKIWNKATNVEFNPQLCHIRGYLGGVKKGRNFCISVRKWLEGVPREIYCYMEPWHTISDQEDPCVSLEEHEASFGEPSQDDGEWHGEGN